MVAADSPKFPDPKSGESVVCHVYTKDSTNNQGGTSSFRDTVKSVCQYSQPELGEQCHVYLLDLYCSKLPPDANTDAFYFRPTKNLFPTIHGSKQVVGHNTLGSMLANICKAWTRSEIKSLTSGH